VNNARLRIAARNDPDPSMKVQEVKVINPEGTFSGVRMLRTIAKPQRVRRIMDNVNPQKDATTSIFHAGLLKSFSKKVPSNTIEPVLRVIICFR
jgi:hypothetical protein